jgi:glycosyltransferase involved in cell wall biosynthesis
MNILMLAEVSADSVIGGAERVLREQALGLRRRGHDVSVVARAPAGDRRSHVQIDGVTEYRYAVARGNEAAFVLSSLLRSVRLFDRRREEAPPDAVVVHQPLAGLGPVLRRRAKAAGWIYICHSLAHKEYLSRTPSAPDPIRRARRTLNATLRLMSERAVLRRCARVVVLSEFMKRQVIAAHRLLPEKLAIVPGGADPDRFRPSDDPTEVRRALSLPVGKVLLFTVRNLVARMGLENLVRAVGQLGEEGGDLFLLIGGEGPLRGLLEQLIADLGLAERVRLLGFLPERTLPSYYQAADLVLMPTVEMEGFGLVTVEALACGTPVLGAPVGAIPEILTLVDPILLADGTDSAALAKGIRRLLRRFRDRPAEQRRVSQRGRELVEADYNWARHCERLEAVLHDVMREA